MQRTMTGDVNNRYRVEKPLGEGGMGTVYLVWDLELERFVALKEIKSSLPGYDKYIERLKKEAKLLGRLNHPNIVTLYDLIQDQGNWYIVMEYVEGMTLDKKLEQTGALPCQAAIAIIKQMLAALDHAHQAGIIHRDFKPGNVMIKADGQVKVMDFGLAKIQTSAGATRSTKSEHTGGTLYYLSPEQVRSDGRVVDQRSDIYALGMTCYEVLAGYLPLKEKTTTVEILNAILRDNFPPPTKFNDAVPRELSKIVRKTIVVKPQKRFQSAREMLEAIEEFEKKTPPPPLPPRGIRLVVEILWTIAIVLLTAGVILFTDWDSRLLEALGLSKPTTLTIITMPDNAEAILNGKLQKTMTPLNRLRVKADTNYVQIRKAGFFTTDTTLVLQKGQDSTLALNLRPSAQIVALGKPAEAEIVLDGRATSLSELSQLSLAVGEHGFVVALQGYKTLDTTIALAQGLNAISFELEKIVIMAAEGRVSLTSEPSGAEVEIRGPVNIKKRAPIKNLKVPAGKYEIRLRYEKYEDSLLAATVDSGGFFSEHVKLKALPGRLNLTINPKGAVYIDQRLVDESTDHYETKWAAGSYYLKIVHPATAAFWADTITIAPAGELIKEFDFSQEFTVAITAVDSASSDRLAAEIYVDGVDTKKVTPDQIVLRFGHHEIEVHAQGYESQRMKLNVESTTKPLRFRLKRLP